MRRFAEHLQKYKEEQGEKKMEKRVTKDDLKADEQLVPFGLADRCYSSDTEDCSKAQRHIETSHCAIREYVDMSLTPELESAVTACLYVFPNSELEQFFFLTLTFCSNYFSNFSKIIF